MPDDPKRKLERIIEEAISSLDIGTGEVIEVLEQILADYRREF